MNPKATTPLDVELGRGVRAAREKAAVTQIRLAETLGVTFQQVQKYESGKNRLSVARLFSIANALNISAESLLAGLGAVGGEVAKQRGGSGARKKCRLALSTAEAAQWRSACR